jgi:acyl-phosphate glycerol 3-phosphate acyltransferase
MSPPAVAALLFAGSYLAGAIPFGYLIARAKGVDLFRAGSGNIGATNVGRVLGRGYGILVFLLDFAKGACPVAGITPVAEALRPGTTGELDLPAMLPAGAAALAFLGHLFPVYLGFRGGKGVATGAGVVAVLVPGPATAAFTAWVVVVLASRYVSLGSITAVGVLVAVRLLGTPAPFDRTHAVVSLFCLVGSGLVLVKHSGNIRRLLAGTENRVGENNVRSTLLKALHILALGTWFGGTGFFSFVVTPTQNATFKEVVRTAPNDRTAFLPLVPQDATEKTKDDLASALFGAAAGPVFPKFFLMQAVCGGVALVTALAWWHTEPGRTVHKVRAIVIGLALLALAAGWPVWQYLTEVRPRRYDTDPAVAEAARAAFTAWHFVSLGLSAVTTLLAGISLALAAKLPANQAGQPCPPGA